LFRPNWGRYNPAPLVPKPFDNGVDSMLDIPAVNTLHRETVVRWHREPIGNFYPGVLHTICEQHAYNFRLWHEEDIARSRDATDSQIAQVKRNIDRLNQQRNDLIERIDEKLLAELAARKVTPASDAPRNTETPASAIDRLSILCLRIYHLEGELDRQDATAEHKQKVTARLTICRQQQSDLSQALALLIADLTAGRKELRLYRQLKMYNDPTLNPVLYRADPAKAA
jgi:hypothetical protein